MEPFLVERAGGVVTLTLNRPERYNAVTAEMWPDLLSILREVAASDDDRVLVVTGAGDAFCSGADMASIAGGERAAPPLTVMRRVGEAALALIRLPKPTIARVNGVAAGAGANLALACDLVIASERARFSQIFAKRGLSIDFGGSWLLPRLVGMHKAKEMVLLADMFSADDAAAMGLVNKVVPHDELDEAVADWAGRLAAGPPLALSLSKQLLNDSLTSSVDQALDAEAAAQAYNFSTGDVREAMKAYFEKRPPEFPGR
ncbi:enoyl-CoA hydratase/isomerase family protein [Acidiferrimicrobium sp. IK]|uniref:enoyl-CoA hydratase/isomerase family protein n=1 Tax=Acidiferrimicrobium sp. IK TaxID=2871700 RepID=UPI0021CB8E72|nr:enoyl-CoA hydratase-related protein [Acidiferrimicrobium sp. IK]MCU4183762.1 enoyl-CoA hydratase/isomerase family protein [Acidiferrimicrobium sp. IK]